MQLRHIPASNKMDSTNHLGVFSLRPMHQYLHFDKTLFHTVHNRKAIKTNVYKYGNSQMCQIKWQWKKEKSSMNFLSKSGPERSNGRNKISLTFSIPLMPSFIFHDFLSFFYSLLQYVLSTISSHSLDPFFYVLSFVLFSFRLIGLIFRFLCFGTPFSRGPLTHEQPLFCRHMQSKCNFVQIDQLCYGVRFPVEAIQLNYDQPTKMN